MLKECNKLKVKRLIQFFLSLLVIQIFFCAEYNNPYDPKVDLPYSFKITDLDTSSALSVFQMYKLTLDDSSSANKYINFSCTVEKNNVAHVESVKYDKGKFQIFFYKPCTTFIYINGIRPNEKKDEIKVKAKVVNLFKITGQETYAKNAICSLSIYMKESVTDDLLKVRWSAGSMSEVSSVKSPFTLKWSDTLNESVDVLATLIYGDTSTLELDHKKVIFKGWAPTIDSVQIISFNPDDTIPNFLNQTDSFRVHLLISDPDSNPCEIIIRDKKNTLLDSIQIRTFTGIHELDLPALRDSGKNTLTIKIIDSTGHWISKEVDVFVRTVKPEVTIADTIEIAYNHEYDFYIESSINSTSFDWFLRTKDFTMVYQGTVTIGNPIRLTPLKADTFLFQVQPKSADGQVGDLKSCIIITKEYAYKTIFRNVADTTDTLFVKINRPDTLYPGLMKDNAILTDSGIVYKWLIPSWISYHIDTVKGSFAVLKFTNEIIPFKIDVWGVFSGERADAARINVKAMQFLPEFKIVDTIYDQKVNVPVFPHKHYTITLTDPKSSPITAIYYKIPQQSTATVRYDEQYGIKIKSTGNFSLIMWCVDQDGAVSNPDTSTIQIKPDLPFIKLNKDTIVVPINEPVVITGDTAFAGKSQIPINSIKWDRYNDGTYDTAIAVTTGNTFTIELPAYPQPTLDSITILCQDDSLTLSEPVKKYIRVYSDIPKIDRCVRRDTSTIYKGLKIPFDVSITDPDDSVLTLKIFSNETLIKTINTGRQDTFNLQFDRSGNYHIRLVAQDTENHISEPFSLSDTLRVSEGRPVIKNLTVKNSKQIFIHDTVQCRISGIDYNGTIKEYRYYINDTLSNPVIKSDSGAFRKPFTNSGTYTIYAQLMDDDSLFSLFKKDSITVRKGQPVIRSISVDSPSFFVNTTHEFSISMADTNGIIQKFQISWNGDTTADTTIQYSVTLKERNEKIGHTFGRDDTGTVIVKMRIQDDDSLFSEWKACTLYFNAGVPVINTISIEPSGVLYVRDSITLSVTVRDINNGIKSVEVSWKNNDKYEDMALNNNQAQKGYRFELKDSLLTGIKIRVTDSTNFSRDSLFPVTIFSGRPIIDSLWPSEVWIKDTTIITLKAHDVNDNSLDSFFIKLDSNEPWIKSLNGSFTGIHFDDTNKVGFRQVTVKVWDRDSLWTEKTCTLNVKLGRPIVRQRANEPGDSIQWVSGSSGRPDTMFFRWTGGLVTMAVGDTDYNGTNVQYYWNWRKPGLLASNTSVPILQRDGLTINDTTWLTVTCKDNDSVRSLPYTFVVFPDGPPDTPLVINEIVSGDSVTIRWSMFDFKDGKDETVFGVKVDYGGSNPVNTLIEQKGKLFGWDGSRYTYKFKPTNSTFSYRIYAKDARGSVSECQIQQFAP